ncbi:hypothetical protein [Microbacterium sp.]|uniref:hypothetical protein n=1 Tax=Microbacterium sp. TaxID=51671 RepID=UPI003C760489
MVVSLIDLERQREAALPPVPVPTSLSDLRGPDEGTVTLPVYLDWSATSSYDLGIPRRVRSLYEVVLREAKTVDEVSVHLNARTLAAVWDELRLPPRIRRAWEHRFAELGAHGA